MSPRRTSVASLERRHTFVERDYNYVPYSKATTQRYPSDMQLSSSKPVPPPAQLSTHYQVPSKNSRATMYAVPREPVPPAVRPYAVVGIGSQPNLTALHNTTQVGYDIPTTKASSQRNKYHNMNLRTARSMSPLKEPLGESQVAPTAGPSLPPAFASQVDTLASNSSSSIQDNYTDVMAKALEQFDSVLQPSSHDNKQIIQTSL